MIGVEFEDVTKVYSDLTGRRSSLGIQHVSFSVDKGEVISILGPNGAGKTTIIKILSGLLYPTSGQVRLQGIDLLRERSRALASLGVMLGGSRSVYWRLTAWENVEYFGALRASGSSLRLTERARELLQFCDLYGFRNKPAGEMSGGMRQKLALACALISCPDILLLDEPTEGLDVQATSDFIALVKALAKEAGKTVVLATHRLDVAQEVSDRVLILNRGEVVANDTLGGLLGVFSLQSHEFVVEGDISRETAFRLFNVPGTDIVREPGSTRITLMSGEPRLVYTVMDILKGEEARIRSISRAEPDLKEIFLRITAGGAKAGGKLSSAPKS